MSSTAIVALFLGSLLAVISAAALISVSPTGVMADSMQGQLPGAVQTVAATGPQSGSSPAAGAATILKVPPTAAPPLPAASAQLLAPSREPFPASASPAATGAVPHPAAPSAGGRMGTVASASAAPAMSSAETAVRAQVQALKQLFPTTPALRRTYERAASLFPTFCQDWERMLHEREVNNLEHLSWSEHGGLETATYTGYGKVENCECKASKEGLPIGKISYEEINYLLSGKTIDQAKHTVPKLTGHIATLEIFSWDSNRWFY